MKISIVEAKTNPKKKIYEDCVNYEYDYKSFLFFQFEDGFYVVGVKRNRQGTVNSNWFKPLSGTYKDKVQKYLKKEELKRKEIIDLFVL